MPGGPTPLGFAYFLGVKFVGYTIRGLALRTAYPTVYKNVWRVGATRTAIGLGAGLLYGALWIYVLPRTLINDSAFIWYFAGLLPVRFAEWTWLLTIFFDKHLSERAKAIKAVGGGTVWSYCLDAIGVFAAFAIPGGAWIC